MRRRLLRSLQSKCVRVENIQVSQTAVRPNTAPASSARSPRDGCGGTNPGPTSNSPTPAPSYSPDEMPNLMPDKGWRRHFEEPIPLPDEMAAKAAQGYYHDFLSPLDLPELELDASDSGRGASWSDFGNSS